MPARPSSGSGLVAGAVAYVASPIDLLPEAILPVVGAADDAVVIAWADQGVLRGDRPLHRVGGRPGRARRPSRPSRERAG